MKIGNIQLLDWVVYPIGGFVRYYITKEDGATNSKSGVAILFGFTNEYKQIWIPKFQHDLKYLQSIFDKLHPNLSETEEAKIKSIVDSFLIRADKLLVFS